MSVIGTVEAVPNRLQILWTVLRQAGKKGIERDMLQHMIVPESLTPGDEEEKGEKLNAYRNALGEFVRSGFADYHDKAVRLVDTASSEFVECIERHLLAPDVNVSGDRGYLAGAIAWFLTREPIKPLPWDSAPQGALREDFGEASEVFDISNKERWQNFAYWARFLGYATLAEIGGHAVVVPDPKRALRRHMAAALPSSREAPVGVFLNRLATATPVFEGGAARRAIEGRFPEKRRKPPRELSLTTSLALRRLQIAGELRALRRDDAEIWVATGLHDGRVSHLEGR
jgi:hypothetical protein